MASFKNVNILTVTEASLNSDTTWHCTAPGWSMQEQCLNAGAIVCKNVLI